MLPRFKLLAPESLDQAVAILAELGEKARIVAGGTDVFVQMRGGSSSPEYLVDIKKIPGLAGCEFSEDKKFVIGALTTHHELERLDVVREKFTILYDGVSRVGSVQIRNRATIGGNICNALPSADGAGPLLALNAVLCIHGPKGLRKLQLDKFFLGPRKTVLSKGEVLTHIVIPPCRPLSGGAYIKHARREAMDLALLGVAVHLELEQDLKTCREARIALSTAAPVPFRAYQAELDLKGRLLSEEALDQAGQVASKEAQPRTSWRSSEEFRRHLIRVLVPRAARMALKRLEKSAAAHNDGWR